MFVDALRYPLADRTRLDGTAKCLAALLFSGVLLRFAARLWPDWALVAPLLLAVAPLLAFLGLLGGVLAGGGFPPLATTDTVRLAGRLLGVATVYLLPAAIRGSDRPILERVARKMRYGGTAVDRRARPGAR